MSGDPESTTTAAPAAEAPEAESNATTEPKVDAAPAEGVHAAEPTPIVEADAIAGAQSSAALLRLSFV